MVSTAGEAGRIGAVPRRKNEGERHQLAPAVTLIIATNASLCARLHLHRTEPAQKFKQEGPRGGRPRFKVPPSEDVKNENCQGSTKDFDAQQCKESAKNCSEQ